MAIVFNNDLTLGLRGRVGKTFVFRVVGGRTIVSHAPRKPDPGKQSPAQRQTRANFKEAAAWAVRTLMNPKTKLYYQERAKALGLPNAYIAAVSDYMKKGAGPNDHLPLAQHDHPEIQRVDVIVERSRNPLQAELRHRPHSSRDVDVVLQPGHPLTNDIREFTRSRFADPVLKPELLRVPELMAQGLRRTNFPISKKSP